MYNYQQQQQQPLDNMAYNPFTRDLSQSNNTMPLSLQQPSLT